MESGFFFENGVLKQYLGSEAELCVPEDVAQLREEAFFVCRGLHAFRIPRGILPKEKRHFSAQAV